MKNLKKNNKQLKKTIMKKLLLFTIAIGMLSCTNDENTIEEEELDCDCDRVVQVNTFNVVGTPENPAMNYYSVYITINDCTEIQKNKEYNTTNPALSPLLGQCR